MTAAFVFAVYAMAAMPRLRLAGGIALTFDGLFLGWVVSALAHLTAFTLVYLVLVAVSGLAGLRSQSAGDRQHWEYCLLWALSSAAIAVPLYGHRTRAMAADESAQRGSIPSTDSHRPTAIEARPDRHGHQHEIDECKGRQVCKG